MRNVEDFECGQLGKKEVKDAGGARRVMWETSNNNGEEHEACGDCGVWKMCGVDNYRG